MRARWLTVAMLAVFAVGAVLGWAVGRRKTMPRFVVSRHEFSVVKLDTFTGAAWWLRGSIWVPIDEQKWDPFRDAGARPLGFDPTKPFTIEPAPPAKQSIFAEIDEAAKYAPKR